MSSVSSTTPSTNNNGCFTHAATLPIKHPELNGALLGRNGSEIKKLKENSEHNFRIKLYNENDSTDKKLNNCTHLRIESYSEEGLKESVKLLRERINILKENRKKRQLEIENQATGVLKLNIQHKSMFIGRSGSNIKTLESNSKCRINVGNEPDEDGCVDISLRCENQETLEKAIEYIEQQIRQFPIYHVMKVDSKEVSKIIGFKGSNIKDILSKVSDDTYISYKKELSGFQITAKNQSTVDLVVDMINEKIEQKEKTMITEDLFWNSDDE